MKSRFAVQLEKARFDPRYRLDKCPKCGDAYWPCCEGPVRVTPPKETRK